MKNFINLATCPTRVVLNYVSVSVYFRWWLIIVLKEVRNYQVFFLKQKEEKKTAYNPPPPQHRPPKKVHLKTNVRLENQPI